MKILLVDTNIFLRSLLNDVPSQTKVANKIIFDARNGKLKLVTPQIIVFEVIFALSSFYRFSKDKVVKALEYIINSDYFNLESRSDFVSALEIYKKNNLDFTDCFLAARAKSENYEITTFDKKLDKYAKNS
jgi:predicted nucleic-acid-binding protein